MFFIGLLNLFSFVKSVTPTSELMFEATPGIHLAILCSIFNFQDEVVERVKARLQEEGREARNLVAYSLPLLDPPQTEGGM